MGTWRIASVRIATSQGIVEIPWDTSRQLRGRLLAAHLDALEDEFAAKGTSTPIVIDLADKGPLLELVLAWIEDVGEVTARNLAARFRDIDSLLAASPEQIAETPGVGKKMAGSLSTRT